MKQFEVRCLQCRCEVPVNRKTTKRATMPEPCVLCNGTGVFVVKDGDKTIQSPCKGCDGAKTAAAHVTCPFCRQRPIRMPLPVSVVAQLPFLQAPPPERPAIDLDRKLFPRRERAKDLWK